MLWENVRVFGGVSCLASAEESEDTPTLSIARRVVVGRARAKALFLTSVADQYHLEDGRKDEEETSRAISNFPYDVIIRQL